MRIRLLKKNEIKEVAKLLVTAYETEKKKKNIMAMNPMALFKVKKSWDTFCGNHPRFPAFLQAVQNAGIKEGTIIEVTVTTPEGKALTTNVKITASDMQAFEDLKGLQG